MPNQTDGGGRAAASSGNGAVGSLRDHIPELDGLRAVAVSLVLLDHFGSTGAFPSLWRVAPLGWVGVDLFFVLSGFLITRILLATRTDSGYYRNFYIRRTLRIFPVYYCVLALIFATILLYHHGVEYRRLAEWGNPLGPWVYLGNFQMALVGHIQPVLSLTPMWSLHVEEQFYLIFPLIVRHVRRQTLVKILGGALLLSPVLRLCLWHQYPTNPFVEYVLLPCRLDGLALGALIAVGVPRVEVSRRILGAVSLAAVLAAFVLLSTLGHRDWSSAFTRTIGYSLFPWAFACCVLWTIRFRGRWPTNWLNTAPVQFIGKRSYAIYLLQFPVSGVFGALFGSMHFWSDEAVRFYFIAPTTVAAAALSWRFLEAPVLRLKDRWAPMPSRAVVMGSTAIAASESVAVNG